MVSLLNIRHAYKVAHRTYPIRNLFDHASVAVGYGQKINLSSGNVFFYKNKCTNPNPKCVTQKTPDSGKVNVVQNICKTTTSDDIVKKVLERYEQFEQERSSKKMKSQKIHDLPPSKNNSVVKGCKRTNVVNGDTDNDVMTFSTTSFLLLDPKLYHESLKAAAHKRKKMFKTASEPALFDREARQTTTPESSVNRSMSKDRKSKISFMHVTQLKLRKNNSIFQETSFGPKPELISEIGLREKTRTIDKAVDSSKSGIISKSAINCSPPTAPAVDKSNSFESKARPTPVSKTSREKCPCKNKTSAKCHSNSGIKSKCKQASSTSIPDLHFWKKPAKSISKAKCGQTASTEPSTPSTSSTYSKPENVSKSKSKMKCKRPADKDIRPTCKKSADDYKSNACKKAAKAECVAKNLSKPPDVNKNRRCLNYMCPDSTWNKISDDGSKNGDTI